MGIGEWRRGRVLGRGSSSTVSLATTSDSEEVFAVKSAELARSAMLQREQRILSSLCSPYVVFCFGFDVSEGGLYYNLFMEYAPGGSLSDEIAKRGGRLDEVAVRSYTREVLAGLAYLHSEGVVHCDVKGKNVLIGSDGHAKIADLGCARLIGRGGGDGLVGEECRRLRGTPLFMAPEVARGEEQGPPSDLWALGCTIIEMATGRPPWPDVSDTIAAIHRVAFSPDVPEFPSWISAEGKDFLSKCLKRDPRERWTAEQLLGHEFVASSSSKPDAERCWVSPKSTLDQAFWESLPDQDEEAVEHPPHDDPSARIRQLISSSRPNWTCDENWTTVRSNGDECATCASCPAEDVGGGETAASWDSSSNSSESSSSSFFYNSHELVQIAGGGEQRFVRCKTEINSSNNSYVSVNYERNSQFEISYWICSPIPDGS